MHKAHIPIYESIVIEFLIVKIYRIGTFMDRRPDDRQSLLQHQHI